MVSYREMSQEEREAYAKQSIEEAKKIDKEWKRIRYNMKRWRAGTTLGGCIHYGELGLSCMGEVSKYIRY